MFVAGAEQFRGRGVLSRVVDFLGRVLLGIGEDASSTAPEAWWKQSGPDVADDDASAADARSSRLVLGRQARLFDDDGSISTDLDASDEDASAAAKPSARTPSPSSSVPSAVAASPFAKPLVLAVPATTATGIGHVQLLPSTEVSVRARDRRTARVVATTRSRSRVAASTATAAASAEAAAAVALPGTLIRSLGRSNSLSRGQDEVRWYSVPRRTVLPRYRLFAGADAVHQDRRTGIMTVEPRATHASRSRVWFG